MRSLGIALVALALLLGQGSLLPRIVECPRCAEHCPMTAQRLGCHSKHGGVPCHSGPRWASGGCNHGSNTPPLARDLALLVPPLAAPSSEGASRFVATVVSSPETPTKEPPTDPPRFSFAV